MIETAEDLTRLIYAADTPNHYTAADHVLAQNLSEDDLRAIARLTLANYARLVLSRPHLTPEEQDEIDRKKAKEPKPLRPIPGRNPSPKVARISRTWRSHLTRAITVSGLVGDTKILGQCTVDDIAYAAKSRHAKASQTEARALQFERLAAAMTEHDAHIVAELPDEVGEAVITDALLQ